ncbi:MAG: halocyanin, partial [Candidatus Dadabacteria bacterium]
VEWTNTSPIVHTVTADPKKATLEDSTKLPKGAKPFNSGNLEPNAVFRHTFTVPGTYRYFCIPHEAAMMRGEIVVEEKDKNKAKN